MSPHNTQDRFITLPDGRKLGYAEYGAPNGGPVLFFHGSPGSRHIHADKADIAARRGVRLIAVDRPSYGLSDPQPGRTMLDWPDDIAALADALALQRYAIIGFSGGSPYALACAKKLPGRVTKIALVGAFAPPGAPGVMEGMSPAVSGLWALAQANPDELRNTFATIASSPAALVEAMSASLPEWDKIEVNKRTAEFEAEYAQALRNGVEGVASDFVLISGNWGFPLDGINTEIHLWCGTVDQNTPPAMTNYLSSILPNSRTFMLPDEGHLSLYVHWEEILERLV
ncbi:MAG: alpha/beta hydrolase [Nitrosomonadales bacterium]|nr:alpha/beta hydrolase [Nitrosomonadales bacterium]